MSLNVTFATTTWLWTSPFTTETTSLFSKIKEMGFDAVEIPVEDPALIDAQKVKHALEEQDLKPVICGAFGPSRDLTHEDPSYHKTSLDYIRRCFQISAEVGARFVAGPMYSAVGKARLLPPDKKKMEWDLAVNNLHKVCVMATEYGQEIALEPLNRFETDLINNTEDLMQLIDDINHPAAKVLLDGFHMNIEERNIVDAISRVGDKLIHVQVSENYRGTPGTGQTRWEDYRKGLELVGYQGVVSIESFTPEIKELAGAVCIWRPLAESQDAFASEGLKFLKSWAS
ncbi:MAG: sugar phosphate isomerase/epimerase [Lunatimonas sp.]|uniref:sugar phosphate isomerase/epimerase family protein n=1 Tax=Lunatimonas sp. TaxID=2060141 RepID=UPI00263A4212|nr:sugar phosphate isomerase/epimerase family protein [Lunatimonas sp.]MCC5936809.1 sugar phosphate isomerase/epimerase [Lunatimonas sp.]